MTRTSLSNHDEWLAAEYALGVLSGEDRSNAENRSDQDPHFRAAVEGWQNQLEPMLREVEEVVPPVSVWKAVETKIGVAHDVEQSEPNTSSFWRRLCAVTSVAAVASVALLVYVTGGDITGTRIADTRTQLAASNERVETLLSQLDEAQGQLATTSGALDAALQEVATVKSDKESSALQVAALEEELAEAQNKVLVAQQEVQQTKDQLAKVEQEVDAAVPLVASLTAEGNLPAFVAQYDPLKRSLLIRTSAKDEDEKVPEIWFIPEKGARKGEVLSLGVMNESAPERIAISSEFVPWMDEGGTLAITMEPPGGSPTGVATGPIIAVGKLQALQ